MDTAHKTCHEFGFKGPDRLMSSTEADPAPMGVERRRRREMVVDSTRALRGGRRGVVEGGGRWAGGGKEHDAAPARSLRRSWTKLAAEAGPVTNTIQVKARGQVRSGKTLSVPDRASLLIGFRGRDGRRETLGEIIREACKIAKT